MDRVFHIASVQEILVRMLWVKRQEMTVEELSEATNLPVYAVKAAIDLGVGTKFFRYNEQYGILRVN